MHISLREATMNDFQTNLNQTRCLINGIWCTVDKKVDEIELESALDESMCYMYQI